ncbi:hypothetical protein BC835DRAFT_513847 [Cytidiella melzeri]|nr:hypothetical protein BC835DRAFT_513847 [Cytidiella melzeri]
MLVLGMNDTKPRLAISSDVKVNGQLVSTVQIGESDSPRQLAQARFQFGKSRQAYQLVFKETDAQNYEDLGIIEIEIWKATEPSSNLGDEDVEMSESESPPPDEDDHGPRDGKSLALQRPNQDYCLRLDNPIPVDGDEEEPWDRLSGPKKPWIRFVVSCATAEANAARFEAMRPQGTKPMPRRSRRNRTRTVDDAGTDATESDSDESDDNVDAEIGAVRQSSMRSLPPSSSAPPNQLVENLNREVSLQNAIPVRRPLSYVTVPRSTLLQPRSANDMEQNGQHNMQVDLPGAFGQSPSDPMPLPSARQHTHEPLSQQAELRQGPSVAIKRECDASFVPSNTLSTGSLQGLSVKKESLDVKPYLNIHTQTINENIHQLEANLKSLERHLEADYKDRDWLKAEVDQLCADISDLEKFAVYSVIGTDSTTILERRGIDVSQHPINIRAVISKLRRTYNSTLDDLDQVIGKIRSQEAQGADIQRRLTNLRAAIERFSRNSGIIDLTLDD